MTGKEIGESVLRSIESHLRDNPMSHDICESEAASDRTLVVTPPAKEPVLGTMLPDLFAGEIAAMGRLLIKMSAALARRALAEQDVLVKCRDAANELRGQALLLAEKCAMQVQGYVGSSPSPSTPWSSLSGPDARALSDLLIDLSASLAEAVESLDERH